MQALAKTFDTKYSRERFFPEDHRSFCTGEMSLCLDRFGGIENITYLCTLSHSGKLFPARKPLEYFSRRGLNLNRPFLSPAIRCLCEQSDGCVRFTAPEYPRIFPNGVMSEGYDLVMGKQCFALEMAVDCEGKRHYLLSFCKFHYESQKSLRPNFNQLAHEHVWLPPEYRGKDFNEEWPFADGEMVVHPMPPRIDSTQNAVFFCKEYCYPCLKGKLFSR